MGRTESKQVVAQGTQQSAQDQANSQAALEKTNDSLAKYSSNLDSFMKFGRSTYGAGGEYMKDQNAIANTTAAAGTSGVAGNLALNAMRTGENSANYAPTVAESARQSSRDLTTQLAGADADRLAKLTAVNEEGVTASALPAQVQSSLYGTGTGGAGSQLGSAASAAKTPGFWDTFAPALAGAAGTAAAGFCPCEGSLIRMADGSDKPVEQLKKGDWVWAPGTLTVPNQVLEDVTVREELAWHLETKGGLKHAGSETHSIALPTGGYALMPDMRNRAIIGEYSADYVIAVKPIGVQKVCPLVLGGSHAYMADGIMCLT